MSSRGTAPEATAFAFEALEDTYARVVAADPLQAAQEEAAAIRERAYAEGFAQGRADGAEAVCAELAPGAQALAAALDAARAEHERRAEQLERDAVELALRVAEKVVAGALEVAPERVLDAVAGALRGIVEREHVVVLVNPEDEGLVRAALEGVDVQADRRVARSGAVVRTADGEVDATPQAKLERAREAVARELARR
jgi:flagellar biosynthesis/type III secretory pathway protein FliH